MRQVFTSARLENVERVAQLLRDAGIEVRITEGKSFNKGGFRGTRSYVDPDAKKPAVWVVQSEDQMRAREILRDEGLMDSTRSGAEGYALPAFRTADLEATTSPSAKRAFRIKMALIAGIVIVLAVMLWRALGNMQAAPPSTQPALAIPPAGVAEYATGPFNVRRPVLPALARALLAEELAKDTFPAVCVSLDGADAPAYVLEALAKPGRTVLPASRCERIADEATGSTVSGTSAEALIVDVFNFIPSGASAGTVQMDAYFHRQSARYKTFQMARVGTAWRVEKTLKFVAF